MKPRSASSITLSGVAAALLGLALAPCALPAQTAAGPIGLVIEDGYGGAGAVTSVDVRIDHPADTCGGFTFGVCHDSAELELLDVIDCFFTPEYDFCAIENLGAPGFTYSTVLGIHAFGDVLPPGSQTICIASYEVLTAAGASLEFCTLLLAGELSPSEPAVWIVPPGGGGPYFSVVPDLTNGSVLPEAPFRRGDTNGDGAFDLADVIYLELYLFANGEDPSCLSACDTNADQLIDIADAIRMLMYLFLSAPPLAEPFATCETILDSIPCDDSACI